MPRYLSAIRSERDTQKKYIRRERGTRIEEDNTSITRSISFASIIYQTDIHTINSGNQPTANDR